MVEPVVSPMTTLIASAEDGAMNQVLQVQITPVAAVGARGSTMQAIVQDRYGSADVLRLTEIERPVIADDEVLVRIRAAGVHIGDLHVMTGQPYLMRILGFGLRAPKARVRGLDFAGTVEAIGSNVTRLQPGDDVYGTCNGAFAEYASARADTLAPKPANLTFEQAAAVPHGAITALQGLRDTGEIKRGQKVLIVGASGDVGMFAVQIAKWIGAGTWRSVRRLCCRGWSARTCVRCLQSRTQVIWLF